MTSWYASVLRPFLLAWFFGIFLAGGAAHAAASFLEYVAVTLHVAEYLDRFGQLLVYLGFALFVLEVALTSVFRRSQPKLITMRPARPAPRRTA